jgi:DNA repair protein RadC
MLLNFTRYDIDRPIECIERRDCFRHERDDRLIHLLPYLHTLLIRLLGMLSAALAVALFFWHAFIVSFAARTPETDYLVPRRIKGRLFESPAGTYADAWIVSGRDPYYRLTKTPRCNRTNRSAVFRYRSSQGRYRHWNMTISIAQECAGSDPDSPNRRLPAVRVLSTELRRRSTRYRRSVLTQADAQSLISEFIGLKDREHLVAIHLNVQRAVIAVETISVGTLSESLVHPREVFKGAIASNSDALILGHNHPSGDLTPSLDDVAIYTNLRMAGELLGIPIVDFLIVHRERGVSLALPK